MMRPTPLYPAYASRARGTLDLLGWAYPAEFSGAVPEHHAVREAAGLFDFSFMAHFAARGRGALPFVQRIVTNDAARLGAGAALYSPICDESGALVDDCTVIRRGDDEYLLSSGLAATGTWLRRHAAGADVSIEDRSAALAVIAIQGPRSAAILVDLGVAAVGELGYFGSVEGSLRGVSALVARIGYTGELGYELFVPVDAAAEVWRLVLGAGRDAGLVACGGRALESLRVEAGYLMTGVDFDETVTPVGAGLGRFVKLDKGEFIGRRALAAAGEPARRLTGLRAAAGPAARRGAACLGRAGQVAGRITSACLSPTVGGQVALAYVECAAAAGADLVINGVPGPAVPSPLPFYDPCRSRVRAAPPNRRDLVHVQARGVGR
jgi:aminomethyltransferase